MSMGGDLGNLKVTIRADAGGVDATLNKVKGSIDDVAEAAEKLDGNLKHNAETYEVVADAAQEFSKAQVAAIHGLADTYGIAADGAEHLTRAQDAVRFGAVRLGQDTGNLTEAFRIEAGLLTRVDDEFDRVAVALRNATISTKDFQEATVGTSTRINDVGPKLRDATRWTVNIDKASRSASGSGLSMFLQQVGYAADDAQYGFRGLSNNLMGLLMPLGVYGSIIAIGAVGTYQLAQHWKDLSSAFRSDLVENVGDEVEKLTKRMEELQKQSRLTRDEWLEMKNVAEAIKNIKFMEQAAATRTSGQEGVKKAFDEALKGDEGRGIRGGVGQFQAAAQIGFQKEFFADQYNKVREAVRDGLIKDENGRAFTEKDLKFRGFGTGGAFDQKMIREYQSQVIPQQVAGLLRRIGEGGDAGAVRELEAKLRKSGIYDVGENGEVTRNGQLESGLTKVLQSTPERARRKADLEAKIKADNEAEEKSIREAGESAKKDGLDAAKRRKKDIDDAEKAVTDPFAVMGTTKEAEDRRKRQIEAQAAENRVKGRQLRREVDRANRKAAAGPRRRPRPRRIGAHGRGLALNAPAAGVLPTIHPGGLGGGAASPEALAALRAIATNAEMQVKLLQEIKRTPKPGYAI